MPEPQTGEASTALPGAQLGENLTVALLALLVCLAGAALLGIRRRGKRRGAGGNALELLGLLGIPALLIALMATAQFSGLTILQAPGSNNLNYTVASSLPYRPALPPDLSGTTGYGISPSLWLLAAFTLGAAWIALSRRRQPPAQLKSGEHSADWNAAELPENRVRAAYMVAESRLHAAGLPRHTGETPAEYLGRAATVWPQAAEALHTLGQLYQPARYGAGSAAGAQEAEAAAEQLGAELAQQEKNGSEH
ncbi:DUF4129 domain-containing protein [Deinococcus lacus]|uniref:DUF4129 domain-containing protein n=1 Tax=Deinococcus lacus TaxID=392561 RepID=A0ABW1YF23_9DEIO